MIKIIITGSTGMVGKGALLECIESDEVSEVLLVNRRPVGITDPKVKELIVKDFFDLSEIEDQLKGYSVCFFSLGVSAVGKSEDEYTKITYDLTMNFACVLHKHNPGMTFMYVSGQGTDSTEAGKMMWARVKGKTENDLLKLGFKATHMFRPGFIIPKKGIEGQWFYTITRPLHSIFLKLKSVTDTVRIGQAAIKVGLNGHKKAILNPEDINALAL